MKNDEMKKILYDLHKENKQDIKELREDTREIKIQLTNHLAHHQTIAKILTVIGGLLTVTYTVMKIFG